MRTAFIHTDALMPASLAPAEGIVRKNVVRTALLLEGIGTVGRVLLIGLIDLVLFVLLGLLIQLIIA